MTRITKTFLLFLSLLFCTCKIDRGVSPLITDKPKISYTQFLLNKIPDENRVHPPEITDWLKNNIPREYMPLLQVKNSQQNVMEGRHVIRIPVLADFTFFFTKNHNKDLQVYAYKHLDKMPGQKDYTGNILEYSFHSGALKEEILDKGKHTFTGYLYVINSVFKINPKEVQLLSNASSVEKTKTIWCLMYNGQWLDDKNAELGMSYGADGIAGKIKCK